MQALHHYHEILHLVLKSMGQQLGIQLFSEHHHMPISAGQSICAHHMRSTYDMLGLQVLWKVAAVLRC